MFKNRVMLRHNALSRYCVVTTAMCETANAFCSSCGVKTKTRILRCEQHGAGTMCKDVSRRGHHITTCQACINEELFKNTNMDTSTYMPLAASGCTIVAEGTTLVKKKEKPKNTFKYMLESVMPFRDALLAQLTCYDVYKLMHATGLKMSSWEKSKYGVLWRDIFKSKRIFEYMNENKLQIMLVGMDLFKMSDRCSNLHDASHESDNGIRLQIRILSANVYNSGDANKHMIRLKNSFLDEAQVRVRHDERMGPVYMSVYVPSTNITIMVLSDIMDIQPHMDVSLFLNLRELVSNYRALFGGVYRTACTHEYPVSYVSMIGVCIQGLHPSVCMRCAVHRNEYGEQEMCVNSNEEGYKTIDTEPFRQWLDTDSDD